MSRTVELERDGAIAVVRLGREHGNAINPALVDDLRRVYAEIASDETVHAVVLAARGTLFCPGLDLQELLELDRRSMTEFLARFRELIFEMYVVPRPVVAALHGHAVAGGCVLGLTADWRLLADEALMGLAEVKVGVPFPYGVSLILRESVPSARLEEVALFGRNYGGAEAREAGLAHETAPASAVHERALERARELSSRDPRALRITKSYLRSATAERIRAAGDSYDAEFLDAWFSPATRQRITGVVEQLRRKKR